MSLEDPAVITCAISGAIASREQCAAIPYTPEEYGAEARRIVDEGGVMIHIHARRPDGTPSFEIEDFRAITEAIREQAGDVIINYSTGAIGVPVEKRLAYLRELRPDAVMGGGGYVAGPVGLAAVRARIPLVLTEAGPYAFVNGTTAYYNGATGTGSSITVTAPNVSDPSSGIAGVTFPAPAGFAGGGSDLVSPFAATYTWSAATGAGWPARRSRRSSSRRCRHAKCRRSGSSHRASGRQQPGRPPRGRPWRDRGGLQRRVRDWRCRGCRA